MDKTYTDMIMMNRITIACVVLAGCVTMFSGCRKDKIEPPVPLDPDNIAVREDRNPFHKSDPMTGKTPSAEYSSSSSAKPPGNAPVAVQLILDGPHANICV